MRLVKSFMFIPRFVSRKLRKTVNGGLVFVRVNGAFLLPSRIVSLQHPSVLVPLPSLAAISKMFLGVFVFELTAAYYSCQ